MTLIPKIIKNENEYEKALERIEEIFDAVPSTPDFDEMKLLVKLVEDYERENYPIDQPDLISVTKFRVDQTS